jgi:aminoglycoside/choline kinase family phosphotransferase
MTSKPTHPGAAAEAQLETSLRLLVRAALRAEIRRVEPVQAGLGVRRSLRLHLDRPAPATVIARVEAPSGARGEPPLEPLRSFLAAHGLPVPDRYGSDPALGIDLLEDVGPVALETVAASASPEERRDLYAEACDLVARLQALRDPGGDLPAFRRHLDRELVATKAELFLRWSVPSGLGRPPRPGEAQAVREAFAWIAGELERAPQRLSHRDFQSSNLHVRPGAPRGRRLVMLDLQGAFLAPPEYDLVCVLRDSYVVLPEDEVRDHLERIRQALPDRPGPEEFARRFDLVTLVRKAKDHARFLEAAELRGDRRRLAHLEPTLGYLRRAATRAAPLEPRAARLAEIVHALSAAGSSCAP